MCAEGLRGQRGGDGEVAQGDREGDGRLLWSHDARCGDGGDRGEGEEGGAGGQGWREVIARGGAAERGVDERGHCEGGAGCVPGLGAGQARRGAARGDTDRQGKEDNEREAAQPSAGVGARGALCAGIKCPSVCAR